MKQILFRRAFQIDPSPFCVHDPHCYRIRNSSQPIVSQSNNLVKDFVKEERIAIEQLQFLKTDKKQLEGILGIIETKF